MNINKLNEQGLGSLINLEKFGLTSFQLKIIAVVTMLIDHTAIVFLESDSMEYYIFRAIGRISFPIFCFLLVEGFYHTSNKLRYAQRIGIFAIISEVPYDLVNGSIFSMRHQNAMFTLFIGILMLWVLDAVSNCRINYPVALTEKIGYLRLNTIIELVTILTAFGFAYVLNSSYQEGGILLILCFYAFREHHIGRFVCNLVFNMVMFGFCIQWWGVLSTVPIALYNEKPGTKKFKYAFYAFYPVHLFILFLIKMFL